MRVGFDTNVLVSALVFPGGRANDALQSVIDGKDTLIASRAIVDELLSVLARKFARDREELARRNLPVQSGGNRGSERTAHRPFGRA